MNIAGLIKNVVATLSQPASQWVPNSSLMEEVRRIEKLRHTLYEDEAMLDGVRRASQERGIACFRLNDRVGRIQAVGDGTCSWCDHDGSLEGVVKSFETWEIAYGSGIGRDRFQDRLYMATLMMEPSEGSPAFRVDVKLASDSDGFSPMGLQVLQLLNGADPERPIEISFRPEGQGVLMNQGGEMVRPFSGGVPIRPLTDGPIPANDQDVMRDGFAAVLSGLRGKYSEAPSRQRELVTA